MRYTAIKRALRLLLVAFALIAVAGIGAEGSGPRQEGRQFFYGSVIPKLAQNGCPSCHAIGYMHPNVTIYEELLRRLAIGDSPTNNAVIYKIANLRSIAPDRPNHPGGQRCPKVTDEPCWTIERWWTIEFGDK